MPETTLVPERAATTIALARVGDRDDLARRRRDPRATPRSLEQLLDALEQRLDGELYTIQCAPHTVVVMTYSSRSGAGPTIAAAVAELLDVLGPAPTG